jgi:hypothetical protein
VTVEFVNSEQLVDPKSPSAAKERKLAQGMMSAVAEVELFPGTPQRKKISRQSQPGVVPSPELYREAVNQLVIDVRQALEKLAAEQRAADPL